MRNRLRKKDRVKMAGKGNKLAQYTFGTKKRADKAFGKDGKTPAQRQAELLKGRQLAEF